MTHEILTDKVLAQISADIAKVIPRGCKFALCIEDCQGDAALLASDGNMYVARALMENALEKLPGGAVADLIFSVECKR